ncbi:hypothetical protein [uncultured Ruegeria sp.]|uniref:portal protein n=1 Tax=uncultured Ruegeria sp. TaxID=259304 RepID=UPI00260AD949|nr:hypothetical protein [uncultured Ruegeria sp.]
MADFETLQGYAQTAWKAQREWREESEDDYAFADGHQWTDTEKSQLEEQSRVPIVFNRVGVMIAAVEGSEINNRTEVRYIPREIGDAKPNEVLSAGAEWFRDQSNAEDEESDSFRDLLICGLGATETTLDWEADPEGEPDINRLDPLTCFWDPHAVNRGLVSGRFFGTVEEISVADLEYEFPGKTSEEVHAAWLTEAQSDEIEENIPGDEYKDSDDKAEDENNTVKVVRIQYCERKKVVETVDPATGKRMEMDAERWKKVTETVPLAMPSREFIKKEWKQAFLGSDSILRANQPDPDGPTLQFMTGHWDRKKKRFYGLLRSMKDPQKFANKWLSQTLHIINSNAKGGVMVEAGAVQDPNQFEESWAAADGVTWLEEGAITQGKIHEKPKAEMPAALMGLTEFAISSIRDVSGINMELLGLRDANQPGVLEYQRRQSAMTTLARFFDSLRYYRKRQGQTILNFLTNHIAPTGRLVRIQKEDLVQYVPLAMDEGTRKFDVIVDDAPSAPNEKEKAWAIIEGMIPMLQQADLSLEDWADILEYSPLPSSFADKVREKAQESKNNGPSPQEQLAVEAQVAEVEAKKAEPQLRAKELELKTAEMAVRSETESAKIALENRKLDMEQGKTEADTQIKVFEAINQGRQEGAASAPQVDPAQISESVASPIVQYMEQRLTEMSEQNMQGLTQLGDALVQISQQIETGNQQVVAAVTAPKRVVYENGRPKGVETVLN